MALDALLKKHFALLAFALGAVAAWFQARGVNALLSGMLAPDAALLARAASVTPPPPGSLAHNGDRRERSVAAVLARNPFDSVTGPLDARPVAEVLPVPSAVGPQAVTDPLGAPACEGVNAVIITESTDPVWSLAALQAGGEPRPKLRRVGDEVGGKQVAYIGYNPREQSPAVWLEGGSLCQVLLFRKAQPLAPPQAAPPPGAPATSGAAPAPGAPDPGLAREIASKIQKTGENEYNVDRSVIDKILENQAELMKQARIVPEQQDGKVVGIRLFGIRPDSLLGVLGMQNGDRLETINGFNMASPEKALEAYARLRTASSLTVKVNRRGQPVTIEFRIK